MNTYDKEFLSTFKEYYPFDRYILNEPKSIGNLFDDVKLVELFDPKIEDALNEDISVKLSCNGVVFRMGYFDFNETIRENIRDIIHDDFGAYEWECLYVDYEDKTALNNLIEKQRKLQEK